MIQSQVDSASKVVSKLVNDTSLIQIQLKLIEDLRRAGFSNEAGKLANVEVDPKKFNSIRSEDFSGTGRQDKESSNH